MIPPTILRLTPKKAPFRRGGVHFPTLAAVIVPIHKLSGEQMLQLFEEPLVDVDASDDGESWRRFSLPRELPERPVTDAAHSPERAIDPSGPIVPRMAVETDEGVAAPPEAADPAVPLVRPDGQAMAPGVDGDRPVAGDMAGEGADELDEGEPEELPDHGERESSLEQPRRRRRAAPDA